MSQFLTRITEGHNICRSFEMSAGQCSADMFVAVAFLVDLFPIWKMAVLECVGVFLVPTNEVLDLMKSS